MHQGNSKYDVIIAGGGPAGSSAAIRLVQQNRRVLLVEQKRFPRQKLCGEFISPECFDHFRQLGVADKMLASNPTSLTETVFYSRRGHRVRVPSDWFGTRAALGLSRAEMDNHLLRRAVSVGVDVLENSAVTEVIEEGERVCGVRIRTDEGDRDYRAPVTLDATGRARVLCRKVERHSENELRVRTRPRLVAFKAHFSATEVTPGACEIYSYTRGYGGLSTIENELANLCFIVAAKDVRRWHSDPELVLRNTLMTNPRAAKVLAPAKRSSDWRSVSLENFGYQDATPKAGLLALGDSAAFIDPFTGSGMLMALESGELAARLIARFLREASGASSIADLSKAYREEYRATFDSRLRLCRLLRHTAYNPAIAEITILICSLSERFRNYLARSTRTGTNAYRTPEVS